MGDDGGITGLLRHFNGIQGFRQGTNLVDLDQNGVGHLQLNTFGQAFGVGDKEVVPDQLHLLAKALGQHLPAFPILFRHTVLDGDDGIVVDQVLPESHHLFTALHHVGLPEVILAFFALGFSSIPEFCGGWVHGKADLVAGFEAGQVDGFHQHIQGLLVALQVRRVAALIPTAVL